MSDWGRAAQALDPPDPYSWHVFISHAGDGADKPFARALKGLLERTAWGLHVFLDDDSLQAAGDAQKNMNAAMETAAVAVLLFSAEFFEREATVAELRVLVRRHELERVQLLPVFLRMRVEECKRRMAAVLGRGACLARVPCKSAVLCMSSSLHKTRVLAEVHHRLKWVAESVHCWGLYPLHHRH